MPRQNTFGQSAADKWINQGPYIRQKILFFVYRKNIKRIPRYTRQDRSVKRRRIKCHVDLFTRYRHV